MGASHGILVKISLGTAAVRPACHQTSKIFSSVNPVERTAGTGKHVTRKNYALLKENAMATVHGTMGLRWAAVTGNGNSGHRIGGENLRHTILPQKLETWKPHTQRHERYISTALPRNGVMLASAWILCTTWRAVHSGEGMLKVVGLMLHGSMSTVGSNKIQ